MIGAEAELARPARRNHSRIVEILSFQKLISRLC
jgi:hypothetical protein